LAFGTGFLLEEPFAAFVGSGLLGFAALFSAAPFAGGAAFAGGVFPFA
jgi:hypothetical protein